jgi:hypothetical protein
MLLIGFSFFLIEGCSYIFDFWFKRLDDSPISGCLQSGILVLVAHIPNSYMDGEIFFDNQCICMKSIN